MERINPDELTLKDKVVYINRVAKVVKGGKRFSFSAVVVVGDGQGYIGVGKGKAAEVPEAIRKAVEHAKKSLVKVPIKNDTIPYEIVGRCGAEWIMMKPAAEGTGIKAGGAVRAGYRIGPREDVDQGTQRPGGALGRDQGSRVRRRAKSADSPRPEAGIREYLPRGSRRD